GLLPARALLGNARPDIAHANRGAVEHVIAIEDTERAIRPSREAAAHFRRHRAWPAAVEPVDRPAPALGVPQAQAHGRVAAARHGNVVLVGVAHAAQDLAGGTGALERDPVVAGSQAAHAK